MVFKWEYSNHLKTRLVWYLNGKFVPGCQMIWYLNGGLKTGLKKAFILTSGEPSVNRIDLRALNLVGPIGNQPVLSLLAVHHLDNQLYILSSLYVPVVFYIEVKRQYSYLLQ